MCEEERGRRPSDPIRHLYVHVPFCPTVCPFCSFDVVERRPGAVDQYLLRIERELAELADCHAFDLDTIYLGGGTPSYLRTTEMERLCASIRRHVGWAAAEATLEVHPATASRSRVSTWTQLGFSRFSVGVQSFSDAVLETLGRPHSVGDARRTIDWCRESGATTSIDLITCVPGQRLVPDLESAVSAGVDQISAYTLTIEEGTPFAANGMTIADEIEARSLELTTDVLAAHGYDRYEVSNYGRDGRRCDHNVAYWTHEPFVGVGPSAASMIRTGEVESTRRSNASYAGWLAGEPPVSEVLDGRDLLGDLMLCGLRLVDGIDLSGASQRCGLDAFGELASEIAELVADDLLRLDGDRLRATTTGMLVLDRIAARML